MRLVCRGNASFAWRPLLAWASEHRNEAPVCALVLSAHWCAPKGASGKWPGRVAAPPRPRSLTVEKLYPAEFIEQQPSSTRIEAPDLPQLFVPVSAKLARWRSAASCFADQKYRRRCVSRRRHDADTRLLSSCVPRAALESGNSHP